MQKNNIMAEYIWMDGRKPTAKLRSKTKIIDGPIKRLSDIPLWSFDGSSTEQAEGHFSDCLLQPVYFVSDPVRGKPHMLVMCEVLQADGRPHSTNTRAVLRKVAAKFAKEEPLAGIEQEYTLYHNDHPTGWPEHGFPHPQGRYYCGIGVDEVYGRPVVEEHMQACLAAGIAISGVNAEVMPSQWEFQIGPLPPYGISDRGASIRIPAITAQQKRGYLEDRRPAANLDPYQIFTALLETICGQGFDPAKYQWEPQVGRRGSVKGTNQVTLPHFIYDYSGH